MTVVNGLARPDFIVIGAMKCGTTTLYRMLAEHPDIGMSRDKEPDFFIVEKNFRRGPQWYSDQFDHSARLHGEASPNYSKAEAFAGVPERIRSHCRGVRLIYAVRDPVVRFLSQYRHSWVIGDLKESPEVSTPNSPASWPSSARRPGRASSRASTMTAPRFPACRHRSCASPSHRSVAASARS
jgi:hypothetical protein